MGSNETNDTVSGSADIVNLASIVMSYERGKPEDGDNIRWLKVTKNRLTGDVTSGGIKLQFDDSSKRIHETIADPTWRYAWEYMDEEPEQLAFPWDEGSDNDG
jgi:hypothetical protein